MKHWTKAELKSAKILIGIEYKIGKLTVKSGNLILRPSRMEEKDYDLLIKLVDKYGKTR